MDARPDLDALFDTDEASLGRTAIVTPVDGAPVDTAIIWESPSTVAVMVDEPVGDLRILAAVRRDHVPALPVGSEIFAARPPEFPDARTFIVDRVLDLDPDVYYAQVH
jgi:hypothetical protein